MITVTIGLALNLPDTVLGQQTELGPQTGLGQRTEFALQPGDLIQLRINGAIRNSGFYIVDPTMTVSAALAMAGGPTPQRQENRVWVFRDGEIITAILRGTTLIADSPSDRAINSTSPGKAPSPSKGASAGIPM